MERKRLPFPFPLNASDILRKRAQILTSLLEMDPDFCQIPVHSIQAQTLGCLLDRYDDLFFHGYLSRTFGEIRLTMSSRLISSAGKFIYIRSAFGRLKSAEIRMSSDFLTRLNQGPFELNGLLAAMPQEAFLIVFEHELCHALEVALYGQTGHSSRFLSLAHGLFGHTATRHSLPTRKTEAAKDGWTVGSKARFPYQGKMLTGVITYIGKSATVMVPSARGEYRDRYGKRYAKYRLPVEQLRKE